MSQESRKSRVIEIPLGANVLVYTLGLNQFIKEALETANLAEFFHEVGFKDSVDAQHIDIFFPWMVESTVAVAAGNYKRRFLRNQKTEE